MAYSKNLNDRVRQALEARDRLKRQSATNSSATTTSTVNKNADTDWMRSGYQTITSKTGGLSSKGLTATVQQVLSDRQTRMQLDAEGTLRDLYDRLYAEEEAYNSLPTSLSWGDTSLRDTLDSTRQNQSNVYKLQSEIESYRNYIGDERADSILSNLSRLSKGYDSYLNNAEIYSKYKSEDEYKAAVAAYEKQQVETERLASLDLNASKKELEALKKEQENYLATHSGEYFAKVSNNYRSMAQNSNPYLYNQEKNLSADQWLTKYDPRGDLGLTAADRPRNYTEYKNFLAKLVKKYDTLAKSGAVENQSYLDRIAAMESDIAKASEIQALRAFESVKNAKDFYEVANKGASVSNPTWDDALAPISVFGWEPFGGGAAVNNMVTFAEKYGKEARIDSAQGLQGGGTSEHTDIVNLINNYMKPEEKEVYNYYIGKGDTKQADAYLKKVLDLCRQRQAVEIAGQVDDNALELVMSGLGGLSNAFAGFGNIDNMIMGKEADPTTSLQYAQAYANSNNKGLWKIANDATSTITQMAPSVLVGAITGGVGGTLSFGASAAGNGYAEMKNLGYSDNQARAYGLAVGISEATLQHLLGGISALGGKLSGNVISKVLPQVDNALAKFAIRYGGEMLSEGVEEALQEVLSPIFKSIITSEDVNIDWGEVTYSGLMGALTAGFFNGVGGVANQYNLAQEGKEYLSNTGFTKSELVNEALEIDPSNKDALKQQEKLDAGKNVSNAKIAQLVRQNESAMYEGDISSIQGVVAERLTELGETGDVQAISHAFAKQIAGEELSRTESRLIQNSDYGQRVINEHDNRESGEYTSAWTKKLGELDTNRINLDEYSRLVQEAEMGTEGAETADGEQSPSMYKTAQGVKISAPAKGVEAKADAEPMVQEDGTKDVKSEAITTREAAEKYATEKGYGFALNEMAAHKQMVQVDLKDKDGLPTLNPVIINGPSDWNKVKDAIDSKEKYVQERATKLTVESASKKYGAQAGAFVHTYKAGQDVDSYDTAYRIAYNMGKSGVSLSYAMQSDGTAYLTETQREFAYQAGVDASAAGAKVQAQLNQKAAGGKTVRRKGTVKGEGVTIEDLRKGFNDTQKTAYKLLSTYAEATGVDIVLYKSEMDESGRFKGAQGKFKWSENTIYIDVNAGLTHMKDVNDLAKYTMLRTFSHEFSHFIEKWNPEQYNEFRKLVFDTLTERGEDVDRLILDKMRPGMSYDDASREVLAEAMTDILPDSKFIGNLAENHKGLLEQLIEKLKEFIRDLKAHFASLNQNPDSAANALKEQVGDTVQYLESIVQMFDKVAEGAVENYQQGAATETKADVIAKSKATKSEADIYYEDLNPGQEGTAFNENGDPVAHTTEDGTIQLSMRTYEENGRTALRNYLSKCVKNNRLTKAEMQEMMDGIEDIYMTCKQFKDKYAPFSTWSDAAVVRDTFGKPVFSVVTPNGDYKMNLDFSLVCKKRRTLDAVFNEMAKRGIIDDFELGQKSVVKINEIIRKHGLETACALCFVDAKRFRQASMADQFTKLYNELVESMVPADQKGNIDHFNFSENDRVRKVENGIHTWDASKLDFSHLDEVMHNYGSGTVEHKTAKYLKTHPEGRRLLLRGDFMSSKGFDAVKTNSPDVLKLYNSKKGTGGPKAAFGDVQYMNEIVQKAKSWTPAKAYAVGGVRIQSFSDYVPRMVFDYVQMIYDLAATKLPAHAYTKEALFVKQFGLTGVKINMSLIPAVVDGGIAPGLDANGDYAWAGESFDYETAKEIQNAEGYTENCGTICVGVSKQHIDKLLSDPNIRMVIPYHKSGLNPIVAHMNKIAEFTDYTNDQRTKGTDGKALETDFDFSKTLHDMGKDANPKAVADQYLQWCADNKYTPKFSDFAWHPNYYKLLEDFTLYDKDGNYVPQREVKAVFPKDGAAFGSMKDLIQSGLAEDAIVEGKRDANLPAIVDEIQNTLPKTEAEIEEKPVEQADRDLEARVQEQGRDYLQELDAEYMDAYFDGDDDLMQELVDKAADAMGYKYKAYHHTENGFTVFDLGKARANMDIQGFYFSADPDAESEYGSVRYDTYLKMENPYIVDSKESQKAIPFDMSKGNAGITAREWLQSQGYDSVIRKAEYFGAAADEYIVFNPSQIKSSEPMTFQDDEYGEGDVIPLSERFNAEVYDIRYQERSSSLSDRLSDREVLEYAAENLDRDELTEGEKAMLDIVSKKLKALRDLETQRAELGSLYKDQQFGVDGDREEAKKTLERMKVLDDKIKKAFKDVLPAETQGTFNRVLRNEVKAETSLVKKNYESLLKKVRDSIRADERAKSDAKIARMRDRRDNAVAIKKYRDRIKADAGDLIDWINHPNNKSITNHVPDALKSTVIPFVARINLLSKQALDGKSETKGDKVYLQNLQKLHEVLQKQTGKYGDHYSEYMDLAPDFMEKLQRHLDAAHALTNNGNEEFYINKMTSEELKSLSDVVKSLKRFVMQFNKFHYNEMFQHVSDAGDTLIGDMAKQKSDQGRTGGFDNFVLFQNARPDHIFEKLGTAGIAMRNELRAAQSKMAFNEAFIQDFLEKLCKPKNKEISNWRSQTHVFTLGGDKVEMRVSHMMGLYLLAKQKDSKRHILNGGLRVATYKKTLKEKITDVKKGGAKSLKTVTRKVTDDGHVLTQNDIDKIVAELDDRQKEVADAMQKFMAKTGADWGNFVTIARFGESLYGANKDYYPIHSDNQKIAKEKEEMPEGASMYAMLNPSFSKERNNEATNRIILYDIFDVFSSHMTSMAQYNAFALPILDFNKWLNYKQVDFEALKQKPEDWDDEYTRYYNSIDIEGEDHYIHLGEKKEAPKFKAGTYYNRVEKDTVREQLTRVFGAPTEGGATTGSGKAGYAVTFIENLLKDINGTGVQGSAYDGVYMKALHNYNRVKVAMNWRSAIQQPLSIIRAGNVLDYNSILSNLNPASIEKNTREMLEHSGIAVWKSLGFYDVNVSRTMHQVLTQEYSMGEKVTERGLWLAEKLDSVTWSAIWGASKTEVMRKQKLKPSDEGFYEAVTKVFEDVIYKTQVVDSVLTKTELMRSKSPIAKTASSFKGEPVVAASLVVSAIDQFNRDAHNEGISKAFAKNKKKLSKTILNFSMVSVFSVVANALLSDMWRDDDEYEEWYEKLWEAIENNLWDELNLLEKIPYIADVWDVAKVAILKLLDKDVYESSVETPIGAIANDIADIIDIMKDEDTKYTDYGVVYKWLQVASSMTGYPLATVTKEAVTVWNNTAAKLYPQYKVKTYDAGEEANIKYAYLDGHLTDAEASAELIDKGIVKNEHEAFFRLQKWDAGKGYTKFGSYYDAIVSGDTAKAELIYSHLYGEKIGEGYLRHEAKDNIASGFTTEVKKRYVEDGEITRREAERLLSEHTSKDAGERKTMLDEWDFEIEHGYSWSARHRGYRLGDISEDDLTKAVMEVEDATWEEARNYIRFLDLELDNQDVDITAVVASNYFEHAEPAGIPIDTYLSYYKQSGQIKGDKDKNGNTIANSRKNKIMNLIHSLPLTNAQKDALYYANNWAASKIHEAPWH